MAHLYYDSTIASICIHFNGNVPAAHLRQAHTGLLKLIEGQKTHRLLADLTYAEAPASSDQQWVRQQALPQLKQAGLKVLAVLMPLDLRANFAIFSLSKAAQNRGIRVRIFDDRVIARHWLQYQEHLG